MTTEFDPEPRLLAIRLGLGDLNRIVCHGYACCCVCPDCLDRVSGPLPAPEPAKQPWELAA